MTKYSWNDLPAGLQAEIVELISAGGGDGGGDDATAVHFKGTYDGTATYAVNDVVLYSPGASPLLVVFTSAAVAPGPDILDYAEDFAATGDYVDNSVNSLTTELITALGEGGIPTIATGLKLTDANNVVYNVTVSTSGVLSATPA